MTDYCSDYDDLVSKGLAPARVETKVISPPVDLPVEVQTVAEVE